MSLRLLPLSSKALDAEPGRRAPRLLAPSLLLLLGLAACQDKTAESAPKPERPVLVQAARFEPRTSERSFVATIRPRVESELGFRVAGKVARRLASVGDAVRAGEPLAVLDETDLRLQFEQAEAESRAAAAALSQAEAELRRVTTLRGDGWSTASAHDRQKAAAEEARGRVARADRSLALAANSLSYTTLAADADGVVTAALIEPGQVVTPGQSAIRLARQAEKEALVAIPEAQIAQVRAGSAALSLWSNAEKAYAARLRELSPSADPATRTYLARFALPDAGPEVQLGMTATLVVREPGSGRVARLPLSALYNQGAGPALWVVDVDGRPALRPVTVAAYEARDVLIAAGIQEGDRIVTLGVQKLDAGQRVRIVQALQF